MWLTLGSDPGAGAIAEALASHGEVTTVRSVGRLWAAVRTADIVVVTMVAKGRIRPAAMIERLVRTAPGVPIAARIPPAECTGRVVIEVVRGGCDTLLLGTGAELTDAVHRFAVAPRSAQRRVLLPLSGLDDRLAEVLACVVQEAPGVMRADDVARWSGEHRRTLERLWRARGWPPPRELIAWGRLLAAVSAARPEPASDRVDADQREHPPLPPHRAGGFQSTAHLRRSAARLLGPALAAAAPQQLPVGVVLRAFIARYPAVSVEAGRLPTAQVVGRRP